MKKSDSPELQEVFQTQKQEANTEFLSLFQKTMHPGWRQKVLMAP